jgi:hypothetical protein
LVTTVGWPGPTCGGGVDDLGHHDRAAHPGHRVRRPDLDRLARPQLLARDGERDLARVQLDRGPPRHLGDRERGALAHADDGLAAEEHAREGPVAGRDAVLEEHVVLEPERRGLWQRRARHRDRALQRRHHARLRRLRERHRRPE